MKRLTAVLLSLALMCPLSALAAQSLPAVRTYEGFSDVAGSDWFYRGVRTCYETGLMNGTGGGGFSPAGTITVAECATIAARLLEPYLDDDIPPAGSGPWYAPYVDYLNGHTELALSGDLLRTATRTEFFAMLEAVTPEHQLTAINAVTALPDTSDDTVLAFYNAGILTGTDDYGTFAGDKTLTRAEAAVMIARLADPDQRMLFTLLPGEKLQVTGTQKPLEEQKMSLEKADLDKTALTVNGQGMTLENFISRMVEVILLQDLSLRQQGRGLDWSGDHSEMDDYFLDYTAELSARYTLIEQKAQELGCSQEELPSKLYPSPTREELAAYAQDRDLLCAKHILVSDQDTAKAVLDGLKAAPTLDQFNALLAVYNTDPGMEQNPDGYLFSSGEMVESFEAGVRALEIGSYTAQPVQSQYGYHIIWRLDPVDHPELLEDYQYAATVAASNDWLENAQVWVDRELLERIDVAGEYNDYLRYLSTQSQ